MSVAAVVVSWNVRVYLRRCLRSLREAAAQTPLDKTFFSPRFGVVADKFGVSWMILVAQ